MVERVELRLVADVLMAAALLPFQASLRTTINSIIRLVMKGQSVLACSTLNVLVGWQFKNTFPVFTPVYIS